MFIAKKEELIIFYSSRGLAPGASNVYCLTNEFYQVLLREAFEVDAVFGLFFKETVQIIRNNVRINFDSWQELHSCYMAFVAGYTNKNGKVFSITAVPS